jgi:LAO/AO transport system kinase
MTDLFLLLLLPGGGDELQGIKRGIVELADLVVVNKADGEMAAAAERSATDYRSAMRLLRPRSAHWEVPVVTCSALEGRGIERIWSLIGDFRSVMTRSGDLEAHRAAQSRQWLWSETAEHLLARLRDDPAVRGRILSLEQAVSAGRISPRVAAEELVTTFWKAGTGG